MLKKLHPFIQYYNFAPISKIRRIIVWIAMNLCTDMVLNSSFFLLFFHLWFFISLSLQELHAWLHLFVELEPDQSSEA